MNDGCWVLQYSLTSDVTKQDVHGYQVAMSEDDTTPSTTAPNNVVQYSTTKSPESSNILPSIFSDVSIEKIPTAPPPPPPPTPPPPLRLRTPEFTSSASPSLASISTTPRQSSSKRYQAQYSIPDRKYSIQQQLNPATLPNAPTTTYLTTPTNDEFFRSTGSPDNLLACNSSNMVQYPHLLASTSSIRNLKPISECNLLCCFYAEFDNTVGPTICYQYPPNFMSELEIQSTTKQLEDALQDALIRSNTKDEGVMSENNLESQTDSSSVLQRQKLDEIPTISSDQTPKATGGGRSATLVESESTTVVVEEYMTKNIKSAINNPALVGNTVNETSSTTIFDSCSEYIITGSELAGNIIQVSTHNVHLLSRPTILIDEETYERNTLLFSIGFVLRRSIDPQPYKAILSKLVFTIRDMEIESHFISQRKEQIQLILEGIVRSMNSDSTNGECNLLLGPADVLHLKLFRLPRMHVKPVNDYSVPLLVRRDWLHQGYEWDLSINWVSMHIDGVSNARQISKRAEVDLEMVRACLRVLKHHNVVQLIDMFCYSNRYESTGRTIGSDMLHEAVEYVIKHTEIRATTPVAIRDNRQSVSPPDPISEDEHGTSKSMVDSFDCGTSIPMRNGEGLRSSSLPNNEGGGTVLASSVMTHDAYMELQNAIVEFFAACHRYVPIGEIWIGFITKRQPSAVNVASMKNIHWKRVFRLIDHRRLVTFGLGHGYIRRVHNYPLLVNRNDVISMDNHQSSAPTYSSVQRPKSASSHERNGRGSSSHHYYQQQIKTEEEEDRRKRSRHQAAMLLDGMHCDDEIVCSVELPFDEILSMFPKNSIVSVFASSDGTTTM